MGGGFTRGVHQLDSLARMKKERTLVIPVYRKVGIAGTSAKARRNSDEQPDSGMARFLENSVDATRFRVHIASEA